MLERAANREIDDLVPLAPEVVPDQLLHLFLARQNVRFAARLQGSIDADARKDPDDQRRLMERPQNRLREALDDLGKLDGNLESDANPIPEWRYLPGLSPLLSPLQHTRKPPSASKR